MVMRILLLLSIMDHQTDRSTFAVLQAGDPGRDLSCRQRPVSLSRPRSRFTSGWKAGRGASLALRLRSAVFRIMVLDIVFS
jgi:hypothetical protein